MKPESFSATALNVAELCLARYHAEHILRGRGISNNAALLGSSVHGALEMFVKHVILGNNEADNNIKFLLELFRMSYITTFESGETDTSEYAEGEEMLRAWHQRTTWDNVEVLSAEVKENFLLPTSIGKIPFNYIWDRHDKLGETTYRVVDYKTNRWGINPSDLRKKMQARAYGLACQIKHPDATRVWVEFDMLRHSGPVGTVFTKEDNAATWRTIKTIAQRIVDTPDENIPETLNNECNFCVRKVSCTALTKNVHAGGVFSLPPEQRIDLRAQLDYQKKAIQKTIEELDELFIAESKETDSFEFDSDQYALHIISKTRRTIDADMAAKILGPNLFEKYGSKSLSMASVDKLLKGDELDAFQKEQLSSLIFEKFSEPSIKIESKVDFDL